MGEGGADDPHDVSPSEFEAELTLLDQFGATPITLEQLLDGRAGRGRLPARPVILTFDDNRKCLYDHVLPVLLQRHITAELFLVTDYLAEDEAHRVGPDVVGEVHPHLIAPEIVAMQSSGAFIIESHSLSHRRLDELSLEEQQREIVESRKILQQRFKAPVDFFAYPFGENTWRTRDITEAAGYRGAVVVAQGLSGRYALHRLNIFRGELDQVRELLQDEFGKPLSPPRAR